jgi:hypothetical protein
MATEQQQRGPGKNAKADSKRTGTSVDSGPYEAIVQGHVEGSRMGQLLVSIPELTGSEPNPYAGSKSNGIVVSYASPFYGTTFGSDQGNNPDGSFTSGQSYGFWCVPPDVGNKVLVMFVAGDLQRGYWFACVYDSPNHHMVPGNGRNIGGASNTKPTGVDAVDGSLSSDSVVPVGEYNISDSTAFASDGLVNTPRYAQPGATMSYVKQGLDKDPVRGAISSSSMREAPSNVYGISTPGRKGTPSDQVSGNADVVFYRAGGHSFVMDDGAADGSDQLMRLRTTGGHQILMNDTEDILYIASASGSQWLEFSASGAINVFAGGGFNLRSAGAINMHSDSAITMCAPHIKIDALPNVNSVAGPNGVNVAAAAGIIPSISINSVGTLTTSSILATTVKANGLVSVSALGAVSVSAGALLSLAGGAGTTVSAVGILKMGASGVVSIDGSGLALNCASPLSGLPKIVPAIPPIPNMLPDTGLLGQSWASGVSKIMTSCSVAPAHEPWDRSAAGNGKIQLAAGVAQMVAGNGGYNAVADAL